MAIRTRYALICDEVRKEETGKFILIGVYTPDIAVLNLPLTVPAITFLLCLETQRTGEIRFALDLRSPSNKPVAGGAGAFVTGPEGLAYLPIRFGNVTLSEQGAYRFLLTPEGEETIVVPFRVTVLQPVRPQ